MVVLPDKRDSFPIGDDRTHHARTLDATAVELRAASGVSADPEELPRRPPSRDNGDVWTMNADGTGATKLTTNYNAESNPAGSPDGSRIAYEFLRGIWVMNADGSGQRMLTDGQTATDEDPAWSADGTRIVFSRGGADIWAMNTVGTSSFPGTGGAIAFASDRDGLDNHNIYRMNADGFGQTRLTDAPGMNRGPSWSADGTRITFTNQTDLAVPGEIFEMEADGSGERNLINTPSNDGASAYSPANNKFAFASDRAGGQFDVFLMTLGPDGQTTGLTRLTTNDAFDLSPAISPDGKRLAFTSDRDGDWDIYVMKLAPEGPTNRPVKITKSVADEGGVEWSPNGRQLAFHGNITGAGSEVFRMNAAPEGRDNRRVNLSKNPSQDYNPTWSPDSKKIAYQTQRTGNWEIFRARATDGANPTNMTNNPAHDEQPAWQPLP